MSVAVPQQTITTAEERQIIINNIELTPGLWRELPIHLAYDPTYARAIKHYDHNLAIEVFERFPNLINDALIWTNIINSNMEHFESFIQYNFSPSTYLLQDRGFMSYACVKEWFLTAFIQSPLDTDRDFFTIIYMQEPLTVCATRHDIQCRYPDLVANAIGRYVALWEPPIEDCYRFATFIAPELWTDKRVAEYWIKMGGPYLYGFFPNEWKQDEDLFLLIAEYCSRYDILRASFDCISVQLRDNKEFLMDLIELNPYLHCVASDRLLIDIDLITLSFSMSAEVAQAIQDETRHRNLDGFLPNLYKQIQDKVKMHTTYLQVLHAFDCQKDSALFVLNQGRETSLVFKKRIAEYLNIPTGYELGKIQRALHNFPQRNG